MSLFRFGVATENNNYEEETEDKVWVRDESGYLILVEGVKYEDAEE